MTDLRRPRLILTGQTASIRFESERAWEDFAQDDDEKTWVYLLYESSRTESTMLTPRQRGRDLPW